MLFFIGYYSRRSAKTVTKKIILIFILLMEKFNFNLF